MQKLNSNQSPDEEFFFRQLVHTLQLRSDWLRSFYQVDDGIERRLYKAAQEAESLETLIAGSKSKHLTRTRIQRILIGHFHLLGQSRRGEDYMARQRKEFEIPLIGNYSKIRSILRHRYGQGSDKNRLAQEMLAWEVRATRTYTLLMKKWPGGNRNLDFFKEVIRTG